MSQSGGPLAVTLLGDGELDAPALGEGHPGLLAADDKDVALTGGESVVNGILQVDDAEATIVTLTVGDDTDTAHVTTTSDHGNGASVELDEVGDLAGLEVNLDGVVDLDRGVGVADAAEPSLANRREFLTYQPYEVPALLGSWFPPKGEDPTTRQSLVQRLTDVGRTHVLASCVTKNGTPPRPS